MFEQYFMGVSHADDVIEMENIAHAKLMTEQGNGAGQLGEHPQC